MTSLAYWGSNPLGRPSRTSSKPSDYYLHAGSNPGAASNSLQDSVFNLSRPGRCGRHISGSRSQAHTPVAAQSQSPAESFRVSDHVGVTAAQSRQFSPRRVGPGMTSPLAFVGCNVDGGHSI